MSTLRTAAAWVFLAACPAAANSPTPPAIGAISAWDFCRDIHLFDDVTVEDDGELVTIEARIRQGEWNLANAEWRARLVAAIWRHRHPAATPRRVDVARIAGDWNPRIVLHLYYGPIR